MNQRRELRFGICAVDAHVMELALRQAISQPLDLEKCHGQACRTVRLLTIPDSDLRDLVQTAFRARLADFVILDCQLAQAAPEYAVPATPWPARPSEQESAGGSA